MRDMNHGFLLAKGLQPDCGKALNLLDSIAAAVLFLGGLGTVALVLLVLLSSEPPYSVVVGFVWSVSVAVSTAITYALLRGGAHLLASVLRTEQLAAMAHAQQEKLNRQVNAIADLLIRLAEEGPKSP